MARDDSVIEFERENTHLEQRDRLIARPTGFLCRLSEAAEVRCDRKFFQLVPVGPVGYPLALKSRHSS